MAGRTGLSVYIIIEQYVDKETNKPVQEMKAFEHMSDALRYCEKDEVELKGDAFEDIVENSKADYFVYKDGVLKSLYFKELDLD